MRGACLLSRRSEDVSIFFGRASVHCEDLLDYWSLEERVFIVKTYWITGSIKNCQRRFVEQFGGRNQPSKR
jgi:hypothetical protein